MAASDLAARVQQNQAKGLKLCAMPWWQREPADQRQPMVAAAAADQEQSHLQPQQREGNAEVSKSSSISTIAKSLLVTKRRLRLDPKKKLYFLYEPGQQVSSAVRIKNTSRSSVAFKFQTNAPKSCFMRPPSAILEPGETIIATVIKFVEHPEQNQDKKTKDKFKIVSLKVKQGTELSQDLFEQQKDFTAVEQVLQVVFLDPQGQSPEVEKLKKRLAEAEAAQQARKKPPEEKVQKTSAAAGVLDEWKELQREKELTEQEGEGVDSP